MRPAFLRAIYLAPAAIATALVAWFVPIDYGPVGKLVMLAFMWLFLAFGLHALHDVIGLGRELTMRKQPDAAAETVARVVAAARTRPQLGADDQQRVREIVSLFANAGVFMPTAPDPAHLFEAAADQGAPITQGVVLTALHEAQYYHDDYDASRCMANLAFHDSHTEQFEDALQAQISDIVRLAKGALEVRDLRITLTLANGRGPNPPCTIAMTVNGKPITETYAPAAKYLSTHLHVVLAIALRDAGRGVRLAWRWDDQGVWMTVLRDDALGQLNAGAGSEDGEWEWVDDAEPLAAGDVMSRSPST